MEPKAVTENLSRPVPELKKHVYATPYGKFVAQRQKSGIWAAGYQLYHVEDRAETVTAVIKNLADSVTAVRQPSLPTLHSAAPDEQRLVWALPNKVSLVPLSSLACSQGSQDVDCLIRSLASAIDSLHQAGLAAFDLSPSLIFVESGCRGVVLVPTLPLASQVYWAPGNAAQMPFVAPELDQACDLSPDPVRADLYALGALAWYLLTGTERKQFPTKLPGDHSPDLANWDAFIDGCCRTRPQRRFGSIGDALNSLASAAESPVAALVSSHDKQMAVSPRGAVAKKSGSPQNGLSPSTASFQPRKRGKVHLIWVAVAMIIGVGIYLRRDDIVSLVPGASSLLVDYQRGFGETILKYSNRSYDEASWKKVQGSDSLRAIASLGFDLSEITFDQVVGWDDDHYWVVGTLTSGYEGCLFRFQNGSWTFGGRFSQAQRPAATVVDKDTLLLCGAEYQSHLYEVSRNGTIDLGELGEGGWKTKPRALAPDLFYVFSRDNDLVKLTDRTLTKISADKYKEAYVHKEDNTPLKQYLARGVFGVQSPTAGIAFGVSDPRLLLDSKRKLVSFKNGVWYEVDELSNREDVNDTWLGCDGRSPRFLVWVGDNGRVIAHTIKGKSVDQSITSAQESTSLKLIKVWGVDLSKYWVMDDSGTVWERNGAVSRVVVRGLYRDDVKFRNAWVSPRGSVYAITEKDVYRLE